MSEPQTDQGSVTVEGMSEALNDLVKAADATDLIKGDASGIEHSGHIDERGKVGGGRASSAGGLDNMMIAKLTDAGLDATTIAAFSEFVGKQTDEDEDEDEEEEMNAEMRDMVSDMSAYQSEHGSLEGYSYAGMGKSGSGSGETLTKSMDDFREDKDIADAIDVSPYLEAMTARTADQIDNMRKSIEGGYSQQSDINRHMAAAMHQMGTLMKSQESIIGEMGKRLHIVEREPNPQRGATSLSGAQALSKGMPGEAGAPGELKKSELLSTLSYMNLEKGITNIGPHKTSEAVVLYEGGNVLDPEVKRAAESFLQQNPNLAQEARMYR